MTRMVCGLILIFGGLSAVPVFAQSQAELPRGPELWPKLKTGATIYVLDTNARETAGIFAKVSESSIALMVDGQNQTAFLCGFREFCVDRRGWSSPFE
jgi:hypothetical protein